MAHIAGKTNTAADFLSRLEYLPKEKIQLQIRDDIKITPLEVNIQNSGTTEEDHIFYEPDENVTEAQLWERKERTYEDAKTIPPQITLNELTSFKPTDTPQSCSALIDKHMKLRRRHSPMPMACNQNK